MIQIYRQLEYSFFVLEKIQLGKWYIKMIEELPKFFLRMLPSDGFAKIMMDGCESSLEQLDRDAYFRIFIHVLRREVHL